MKQVVRIGFIDGRGFNNWTQFSLRTTDGDYV